MVRSFVNFQGQVALVTGAGSQTGIGFQTAMILGELGARVAITATTDRIFQRAEELADKGIEVRAYIADLMDRAQVRELAGAVRQDFGRIDVLGRDQRPHGLVIAADRLILQ